MDAPPTVVRSLNVSTAVEATGGSASAQDALNATYLTACEAHLDAMGVVKRSRQNILDRTPGEAAAALVRLENDIHLIARMDVFPMVAFHIPRH
jgi:hypothetical protein